MCCACPDAPWRVRGKSYSDVEKGMILQAVAGGLTYNHIAEKLGRGKDGIKKFILRYRESGTLERKEGSGRKRKTTPQTDRRIRRAVTEDREVTSSQIQIWA